MGCFSRKKHFKKLTPPTRFLKTYYEMGNDMLRD